MATRGSSKPVIAQFSQNFFEKKFGNNWLQDFREVDQKKSQHAHSLAKSSHGGHDRWHSKNQTYF